MNCAHMITLFGIGIGLYNVFEVQNSALSVTAGIMIAIGISNRPACQPVIPQEGFEFYG